MGHHREPIKNTCPEIDKYIKSIRWALTKERDLKNMQEDDLRDAAISMSNELESCIDYLESLRTANDKLRQWGTEEAENADKFEAQIDELEISH